MCEKESDAIEPVAGKKQRNEENKRMMGEGNYILREEEQGLVWNQEVIKARRERQWIMNEIIVLTSTVSLNYSIP